MIPKVNPGSWSLGQDLTFEEINQLDTNTTYGLDKRDGYTDTLASIVTVTGSVEFQTGSDLILDDPSVFKVSSDNGAKLNMGAEIIGDTRGSAKDPLRLGYQAVAITSASQTLTAAQCNTQVIKFTGTLTADTFVTFPAISGYAKIIDNTTTQGGFNLIVTTPIATNNGLVVLPGSAQWIYCDGVNLNFGPKRNPFNLIDWNAQNDGYNIASPTYQSISSTSFVQVTNGSTTYSNQFVCQKNDLLEISYTAGCQPDATSGKYIQLMVIATLPDASTETLPETTLTNVNSGTAKTGYGSFTTLYTTNRDGTYTIGLYAKVSSGTGSVQLPLTFVVKQNRP